MFTEVWQTVALSIGSAVAGGVAAFFGNIALNFVRTRDKRKKDMAEADMAEGEVEVKRINIEDIKDAYLRESVSSAYKQLDDMNDRLSKFRERLLELEDGLFKMTQRAMSAERQRDTYRNALSRLVKFIISTCPGIDVQEYKDIAEYEKYNTGTKREVV